MQESPVQRAELLRSLSCRHRVFFSDKSRQRDAFLSSRFRPGLQVEKIGEIYIAISEQTATSIGGQKNDGFDHGLLRSFEDLPP